METVTKPNIQKAPVKAAPKTSAKPAAPKSPTKPLVSAPLKKTPAIISSTAAKAATVRVTPVKAPAPKSPTKPLVSAPLKVAPTKVPLAKPPAPAPAKAPPIVRSVNTNTPNGASRTKFRRIVFCEPRSQHLVELKKSEFTSLSINAAPIKVTEEFYPVLCGVPAKVHKATGNAYIFGERFPLEEYKLIGEHSNDMAQTGFIDFDLIPVDGVPNYEEVWTSSYPDSKWELRNSLKKLQKDAPFVLWVGETVGGDVGASIYAHFKQGTRHIDGLIVDVNCLIDRSTP